MIDTTPADTRQILRDLNRSDSLNFEKTHYQYVKYFEASELVHKHYTKIINSIWKPLSGPVGNWPLALCDPRSVDASSELRARDLVYPDKLMETYQLHHNKKQKWYYVSSQTTEEAWVFLQADSAKDGMIGT